MENEDTPHELMSLFAVIWGMIGLADAMNSAAREIGMKHAFLPWPDLAYTATIPEHLVAETWPTIAKYYEGRPHAIMMRTDIPFVGPSDLQLAQLDDRGMLPPVLWVRRSGLESVELPNDTGSPGEHSIIICTLDMSVGGEPQDGVCWSMGNQMYNNEWLLRDISKAELMLSELSTEQLEAELDSGETIVRGHPEAVHFWEPEWVIRPVTIGPDQERAGKFPFPEYRAIPFYRAGDETAAFEMIMDSYLHIPLLTEITDSWVARSKLIHKARERKQLPPIETRGRPLGRPREDVMLVGRLWYEDGKSKAEIARRIFTSWATVDGYLREYDDITRDDSAAKE